MVSDENENKDELNISTKSSCSSGSESFSPLRDFGHSNQNHQNFDGDLAMIQDKMKVIQIVYHAEFSLEYKKSL